MGSFLFFFTPRAVPHDGRRKEWWAESVSPCNYNVLDYL